VFVITDGYGDNVNCAHPKKWYWFLTPNGSRRNISEKSNVFELKDYE
jgi:predicted metal-dependent peptidase